MYLSTQDWQPKHPDKFIKTLACVIVEVIQSGVLQDLLLRHGSRTANQHMIFSRIVALSRKASKEKLSETTRTNKPSATLQRCTTYYGYTLDFPQNFLLQFSEEVPPSQGWFLRLIPPFR